MSRRHFNQKDFYIWLRSNDKENNPENFTIHSIISFRAGTLFDRTNVSDFLESLREVKKERGSIYDWLLEYSLAADVSHSPKRTSLAKKWANKIYEQNLKFLYPGVFQNEDRGKK